MEDLPFLTSLQTKTFAEHLDWYNLNISLVGEEETKISEHSEIVYFK